MEMIVMILLCFMGALCLGGLLWFFLAFLAWVLDCKEEFR